MQQNSQTKLVGAAARFLGLAYGLLAYLAFNSAVIYCVGFVGNILVPLSVDVGPASEVVSAVVIDVLLLALFGLQHSVMARPGFKAVWTRVVPEPLERSTYVLLSSIMLGLVMWQWRPIPQVVWQVDAEWARMVLWCVFAGGWFIAVSATFLTNHFELLGLKQSFAYFCNRPSVPAEFRERVYYRWVRHPIMLGQIIAFWAIPTMTAGHLLFAVVMLAYVLIGLHYEERDLLVAHGDSYRHYQKRTPKLIPRRPRVPQN